VLSVSLPSATFFHRGLGRVGVVSGIELDPLAKAGWMHMDFLRAFVPGGVARSGIAAEGSASSEEGPSARQSTSASARSFFSLVLRSMRVPRVQVGPRVCQRWEGVPESPFASHDLFSVILRQRAIRGGVAMPTGVNSNTGRGGPRLWSGAFRRLRLVFASFADFGVVVPGRGAVLAG
jgi:hypothetical protein